MIVSMKYFIFFLQNLLRYSSMVKHTQMIVPWTEMNTPDGLAAPHFVGALTGETEEDFVTRSFLDWQRISHSMIVTGNWPQEDTYRRLRKALPQRVSLWPGMKTFHLPGTTPNSPVEYDWSNPAAWNDIAVHLVEIARACQTNTVILENEGSLWAYHHHNKDIDLARLKIALAPLRDSRLRVLWYWPCILENIPDVPNRKAKTRDFVDAVFEAMSGRCYFFADYRAYGAWWRADPVRVANREEMLLKTRNHVVERWIVSDTGRYGMEEQAFPVYGVDDFLEDLTVDISPGIGDSMPIACIYPGPQFLTLGQALVKKLGNAPREVIE